MKQRILFTCVLLLAAVFSGMAQQSERIVFRFIADDDIFRLHGNETELERLYNFVEQHKAEIIAGRLSVRVDAYCASSGNAREDIQMAFIRANRVKSELITHKGLREEHFITRNYVTAYEGDKDAVVVTLQIPAREEARQEVAVTEVRRETQITEEPKTEREVKEPVAVEPVVQQPVENTPELSPQQRKGAFFLRTNLLYDAFLTPTLGIEWRAGQRLGLKLDGSSAWWSSGEKVQKIWLVNPEIRWYMGEAKSLYFGAGGNYGEYNTYGYLLGSLFPDNTGYQGKLYGGGITAGYQARLTRCLLLDLNIGLGMTRLEYDVFYLQNDIRTYKEKDCVESRWGISQAGISLVWKLW